MKFLCFGEILFDIFGEERKIGGAPFNFAAHAARAGAQTYLISAVGKDELGEIALHSAERYGVRTDYISRSISFGTGACRVTLDENNLLPKQTLTQRLQNTWLLIEITKRSTALCSATNLSIITPKTTVKYINRLNVFAPKRTFNITLTPLPSALPVSLKRRL